ncbi:hypothetical protein D9M69_668080 [compost metagenome]
MALSNNDSQNGMGVSVSCMACRRSRRLIASTAPIIAMVMTATMPVSVIVVVRLALSNTGRRSASQIITTSTPSTPGSQRSRVATMSLIGGRRHDGRFEDRRA